MISGMDDFALWCAEIRPGFDKEEEFIKALHTKIREKGIEAIFESKEQIGGGKAHWIRFPDSDIKSYGMLAYYFSEAYFYGTRTEQDKLGPKPNIADILEKVSDPRIVNLVATNALYFSVGTNADIADRICEPEDKIPSVLFYNKVSSTLTLSYEFIQTHNVEQILETLQPRLRKT